MTSPAGIFDHAARDHGRSTKRSCVDLVALLTEEFGNIDFPQRSLICIKRRAKDQEHVAEIWIRSIFGTTVPVLAENPRLDVVVYCDDDATLKSELKRLVFGRRVTTFPSFK